MSRRWSAMGVALATLLLAGCGEQAVKPGKGAETDGTAAALDDTPVPAIPPSPDDPDSTTTASPSRPAELNEPKTGGPMPLEPKIDISTAVIPNQVQGRWGLVPGDCTSMRGDAKGLLVIGPTTLKFYESLGTLRRVAERDVSRIRATFAFEGEGQSWRRDQVLDAQDDGRTLIRREFGTDAMPGPLKYTRCPA